MLLLSQGATWRAQLSPEVGYSTNVTAFGYTWELPSTEAYLVSVSAALYLLVGSTDGQMITVAEKGWVLTHHPGHRPTTSHVSHRHRAMRAPASWS